MKATLQKLTPVRAGAEMLLTILFTGAVPRTHTYRVPREAYDEAGAPAEDEVLSDEALSLLTEKEDARLAYARAVKILAAGDNTRAALLRKLTERGFSRTAAESAVARLSDEGYIKEEEMLLRQLAIYAKRSWGPKKILPTLLGKGFSREAIRHAMERAKEEGVYDADEVRAALLAALPSDDENARRAWLYKHGF